MSAMRTIKVTGKGKSRVTPDAIRLTLIMEETYPEYQETFRHSAQDTAKLRDLLVQLGFKETDLKTLYFYLDTKYEQVQMLGSYERQFVGYQYNHEMKVEFPFDNDRLGKILQALAASPLNPRIKIGYTVRDPEAVKNDLLGKAVRDAAEKAEVLASASRVRLKEIQSADYSWGELDLTVYPIHDNCLREAVSDAECDEYYLGIEPDEMEVEDTVTIVWEIE